MTADARDRRRARLARRAAPRRGHLGERFPTILARCREHGIDPVNELVPVAPAGTTPAAAYAPTCMAARPCRGSTPAARSPAQASTAPTGWPPTRCSRGWCSATESRWTSPTRCRRRRSRRGPARHAATARSDARLFDLRRGDDGRCGRRCVRTESVARKCLDAWPISPPSDRPTPWTEAWETSNLHDVAARWSRGCDAPQGDPRRALARGLPDRDDSRWRGRLCQHGSTTARSETVRDPIRRSQVSLPSELSDRPRRGRARSGVRGGPGPGAVEEDLARGVDVTSEATVPVIRSHWRSRRPGSRRRRRAASRGGGLRVRVRRRREIARPASDGDTVARGEVLLTADRADSGASARRAHGAESALPPVGRRDGHPALDRRARRHRCGGPRYPQDDAGAACPGEVRGPLRRRREPPDVAVRRGVDQGQPHHCGRGNHRRVPGREGSLPRRAGRDRGRQRGRSRRGGGRRCRGHPAGQLHDCRGRQGCRGGGRPGQDRGEWRTDD